MTENQTHTSLLPHDAIRSVFTETVARELGHQLAQGRSSENPVTVTNLLLKHSIAVPAGTAERIDAALLADTVYDNEANQAYRAFAEILLDLFGTETLSTGWFDGEWLRLGRRYFITTNQACPECAVNPLCVAQGDSLHCLDTVDCGHRLASL